ncbi:ArsR/SmtB family transcription factor [Streptomyces sedi]|uniref:Helix-turn-helix domain-containing protein n=1 Tax=Streptomyces sedi TaxID=555059 RepID=A0A5C4VD46_9ACTN|nr:helix-turn-helix domain-containing protein [Streptomyces sedi]TNM33376.1 helix-turn-helix domain-containing protein [Streptomyces sedi]
MTDTPRAAGASAERPAQPLPHLTEPPVSHIELDARGLRALAHPVRVRLLGLLRVHGPSTATLLAQRMELTSGATSYHLRQLAAAGFVAEDTGRGNGRERWWRSVHQSTAFRDMDLARREMDATLGYLRSILASHTLMGQRALNELETMPREWGEVVEFSDALLRLTPEEAKELRRDISGVLNRYRRYDPDQPAAPEGAERVSLVLHLLPDLDGGGDGDGDGHGEAGGAESTGRTGGAS